MIADGGGNDDKWVWRPRRCWRTTSNRRHHLHHHHDDDDDGTSSSSSADTVSSSAFAGTNEEGRCETTAIRGQLRYSAVAFFALILLLSTTVQVSGRENLLFTRTFRGREEVLFFFRGREKIYIEYGFSRVWFSKNEVSSADRRNRGEFIFFSYIRNGRPSKRA